MTTMAAVLGALPLMLGTGTGSELRHPLGIAIVGGLLFSQVLTLFTTPVIYLWFDRLAARFAGARRRRAGERMSLSTPFIRRPVATTLLTLGVAGRGRRRLLPAAGVAAAARSTSRPFRCSAQLPGRQSGVVATSVATPLERHLGQIADVTEMTSSSTVGATRITLQFGLDRDINGAARDVQAAINAARADLPSSLRSQSDLSQGQSGRCADPDPGVDLRHADAAASSTIRPTTVLAQKLSQVDGIGEVTVGGSSLPAVRVELNPRALVQIRDRARGRASGARCGQCPQPERRDRCRRPALPDLHQRSGHAAPPSTARWSIAYRNEAAGAAFRCRRGRRFGRESAQCRPRQWQTGCSRDPLPAAGRQHHRDRRPRSRRYCPHLRASVSPAIDITVARRPLDHDPRLADGTSSARCSSRSSWSSWSCSCFCAIRARR